jgi:PAS domain S-box-containing protein
VSANEEWLSQHLAEVVQSTQDAVLSKDLEGIVTSWNPAAERLYGHSEKEAIGRHVSFLVPPDRDNEEMEILARVRRRERVATYETERVRKDGSRIDVALTISPIEDPVRGVVGASVIARDITTERRRRRGQDFLVAATRDLDASLDVVETARHIVNTAVPELAELCVIDFLRPDGSLGDSVIAAFDQAAAAKLEAMRRDSPLSPDGDHPVAQVLRAGRPMIWRDLTRPEVVEEVAQSAEHHELLEELGYRSAAVAALSARGRTLGVLTFLHASNDLRYDTVDLELVSELADRAALALDNARIYQERDEIATNLQRGLRPPNPAKIEGIDLSVAFQASGEGIDIGGDLYDVLPAEGGCWILVADVVGKGSAAAAVSVAVRHSVRGLAHEIDDPAEILSRVNDLLLEGPTLNDFATAILVRLRRDGRGWELTLAAAGHPAAVVLGPAGTAEMGGGSMLGAFPESSVATSVARLDAGETLVLATDGWFEAGPIARHLPPSGLAETVASLGAIDPAAMTERLRLDAVKRGDGHLRDDLVVLAARCHPS